MNTLLLLGVLLTFQWDQEGCPAGAMLSQGTPVPVNQPKSEVSLRVVLTTTTPGCSVKFEVPIGTHVFAMNPSPPQSNRCAVLVYPDNTWSTDCLAPTQPGPKPPTNFRFP